MSIDPAWIALIGTLCGGVGLRVAEHYLGQSKVRSDDATKIRDELRLEINEQRLEIRELETGLDRWRKDYYDLRDLYIKKETDLMNEIAALKRQIMEEGEGA